MGIIKNNLPTDSQPWGRDIEDRLTSVESAVATSETNNASRDAQLQSSVNALSTTISQANTASQTQHKTYFWNYSDNLWSRPPVLSFVRPSWANALTITTTAKITGISTYQNATTYSVAGYAGIFIDGDQTTSEQYDWALVGASKKVAPNTAYLSVSANSSNGSVKDTITLNDVTIRKFDKSTLNVWASFQSSSTLSSEIPPDDYANWTNQQKTTWSVGITPFTYVSVEIIANVVWLAQ